MKRYFSPWIALGVGLVLTIVASLEVKKAIEKDVVNEFAFTSDQVTLKIRERLEAYALTLKGGAGFFASSNVVDRREWQAYVEKLRAHDSVPGVQGIGFSELIPPHQLDAHIARIRAEGFPDYTVRPPGERALYSAIIYLEPFSDRNLRAFGFDMFSEPVRRAAMERARDTNMPALSGKVQLVQETGSDVQAGTLMYVPVYRNGAAIDTVEQRRAALLGWAYSPYRMKDLMGGILASWDDPRVKKVELHIYDGLEAKGDSLLYDTQPGRIHQIDPLYYQQRAIDFNGKHWLLEFLAGEGTVNISYASAWATLAGGILLSSLLCGLMLALARTQARAKEIADTLTDALRTSESFLKSTIDGLSDHITVLDDQGAIILTNKAYRDFGARNGIEPRTVSEGTNYLAVCETASGEHSEEAAAISEGIQQVLAGKRQSFELEYPCHSPTEKRWFIARVTSFIGEGPRRVIVAHENITERRLTQQELETQRTELHTLLSTIPDLIWLKDVDGTYLACNPEFERFFGAAEKDILGKTDYDFTTKDLADFFRENDRAAIAAGKASRNEEWITYASDGRRVLLETTKVPMWTSDGRLLGVLGIGHDITDRKSNQEKLEHIAHFDSLTGLPNRVLLADRLHQAMTQALRRKTMLAVTFLDLDGFKAVNDQYSHKAGDHLLAALAGHMKRALREGDTLARIGGDEFIAVLIDLPDVESSAPMLSRMLEAATETVYYEGNALRVSASMGVSVYPQAQAIDADQLIRQADQAMYQAKQSGKNRYQIFDNEHTPSARDHQEG